MSGVAPYPNFDGSQLCRDVDAELFFPVGSDEMPADVCRACSACTFRDPCLRYAMAHGLDGIWGGTTLAHRRRLRAQFGWIEQVGVNGGAPTGSRMP